jgi:surface protein
MVDWGDGTVEAYSSSITFLAHTYTTAGDKIIKMQGITRFYNGITGKLISVDDWGGIQWSSMENMFYNATKLTTIPTVAPNLSHVTSMHSMFRGATAFNQPLNSWDVSNVTNMARLFGNASVFNQPLNKWDVSNVTNMGYMFRYASAFSQDLSSWCVPSLGSTPWFNWWAGAFTQPQWGTCPVFTPIAPLTSGFTTTWKVGTSGYGDGGNTISIGIVDAGIISVDWGDGIAESSAGNPTKIKHTYATAGTYQIKVQGITRFYNF